MTSLVVVFVLLVNFFLLASRMSFAQIDKVHQLMEEGVACYQRQQYAKAKEQFSEALVISEHDGKVEDGKSCRFNLALVAFATNEFKESESYLQHLLNELPLPAGISQFTVMSKLAATYAKEQREGQAEVVYRKIIQMKEARANPLLDAKLCSDFAAVLHREDKNTEAADNYSRARDLLKPRTKEPGVNDLSAQILSNLGLVYLDLNQLTTAELCERDALQMTIKLYGLSSRPSSIVLNNLGGVLQKQNKLVEAESLYEQANKIQTNLRPARLGDRITYLINMAGLQLRKHNFTEAELKYQEALKLTDALGDQRGIEQVLSGLATCYAAEGKTKLSKDMFNRAFKSAESRHDQAAMRHVKVAESDTVLTKKH